MIDAIKARDHEKVRSLLASGAEPNSIENENGVSPLELAVAMGQVDTIKYLVDKGADISHDHYKAYFFAAMNGNVTVVELFIGKGVSVNTKSQHGVSGLMAAASQGRAEVVRFLLGKGADKSFVDKGNKTALDYALESHDQETIAILQHMPTAEPERKLQPESRREAAPEPVLSSSPFRWSRTLTGHRKGVFAVGVSADARRIGSGAGDGTVKIWNAETGECVRTLDGDGTTITAVAFSEDGRRILAGTDQGILRIWNTITGERVRNIPAHTKGIRCVRQYQNTIVSVGEDDELNLWNASTGLRQASAQLGLTMGFSFGVSVHQQLIAVVGSGPSIRIHDLKFGKHRRDFGLPTGASSVSFSPDGTLLAVGGIDGNIRILDLSTGQVVRTLGGHTRLVLGLEFSPHGTTLFSASMDKTIRIWDSVSGKCLQTLDADGRLLLSFAAARDGRTLVSGGGDDSVKIWRRSDGATK